MGEALTIRATGATTQTYEEFYGLGQSPFSLAPDPHFLYLSESHDEAIRQLLDAARRNEGVIVLTGEVGTGKTTIARALLTRLDKTSFASLVLNPFLSVDELLREILLDFGVISRDDIRSGAPFRVPARTSQNAARLPAVAPPIGAHGVLIIDEAQHLRARSRADRVIPPSRPHKPLLTCPHGSRMSTAGADHPQSLAFGRHVTVAGGSG